MTYVPQSVDLFPIQHHGNTPQTHKREKILHLIPHASIENPGETKVRVFYWYANERIIQDLPFILLLDAFQKYYERAYRHMIVSAQISIEILSHNFFDDLLQKSKINSHRRESFLKDHATIAPQIFSLLPLVSTMMKFPLPEERVISGFKCLVEDRNNLVHKGTPKKEPKEERLQNELIGAFLLFKYFKILHGI